MRQEHVFYFFNRNETGSKKTSPALPAILLHIANVRNSGIHLEMMKKAKGKEANYQGWQSGKNKLGH